MSNVGMNMQWDHLVNAFEGQRYAPNGNADPRESRHFLFVREFASVVSLLQVSSHLPAENRLIARQDKAAALIETTSHISSVLDELGQVEYTFPAFSRLLAQEQKTVDHLNLEDYGNVDAWVVTLNDRISKILSERLVHAIDGWCKEFRKSDDSSLVNGDGPHSGAIHLKVRSVHDQRWT